MMRMKQKIRKAMLTHTKQKVLVVDHTKFIDVADNLFFRCLI